jgi:N-acetylmuramoyl-L-alanine amidase
MSNNTRIVISSGHGRYVRGASGIIDEVEEARKMTELVATALRNLGADVTTFHDNTSTSQDNNLQAIVGFHNSRNRDLDCSIHFNAYEPTENPCGTECLYLTQGALASDVAHAIAEASSLVNRGPKKRTDLTFLNQTEMPAILIEVCFADSVADVELYELNKAAIAVAISETLAGIEVPEVDHAPPEVQRPENRVDITGSVQGTDVAVIVNGSMLEGHSRCSNIVEIDIMAVGDVVVVVNGQELHPATSTIPANQKDIIATVFGGSADPNVSAYDETLTLNDTDLYVALPSRFEGRRPKVRVHNRASGKAAEGEILDVGPWMIDDSYWAKGTRPVAETCWDHNVPLPSGPNAGEIPNGAGIDVSPAIARAIGLEGKGKLDWEFILKPPADI